MRNGNWKPMTCEMWISFFVKKKTSEIFDSIHTNSVKKKKKKPLATGPADIELEKKMDIQIPTAHPFIPFFVPFLLLLRY